MSPIEVPAKIQLVEKRETRTSRGMLSKGWYHVDGQLVMVKGNSITEAGTAGYEPYSCLLYTSPSPRDRQKSRMPSSA